MSTGLTIINCQHPRYFRDSVSNSRYLTYVTVFVTNVTSRNVDYFFASCVGECHVLCFHVRCCNGCLFGPGTGASVGDVDLARSIGHSTSSVSEACVMV